MKDIKSKNTFWKTCKNFLQIKPSNFFNDPYKQPMIMGKL